MKIKIAITILLLTMSGVAAKKHHSPIDRILRAIAPSCSCSIAGANCSCSCTSLSTCTITSTPIPSPTATYTLAESGQANRSGGIGLNGLTIGGNAYIFTAPSGNPSNPNPVGISGVCYWLDNPSMSGTATHCETLAPYDYATSASTSIANPWDTTKVGNGQHTIRQKVSPSGEVDTATFTINNGSTPTPPPNTSGIYSPTSFWNTPIPPNPSIDPNSSTMIQQSILNQLSKNITFSNGGYGMALAYAKAGDPIYSVKCTQYCNGPVGMTLNFPIPSGTVPATGSDHHLVVAYMAQDGSPYAGKELDMWEASYSNGSWSAAGAYINDLKGWGAACPSGQHCLSNVAAGFSGLGGAVRPEEIAAGHIDHALAIATPYNRTGGYFACPATHHDEIAGSTSALPQGARIQLDPSFNVDAQNWPQWIKIIAKALQTYGAYNRDFSGVVVVYGVTDQNAGVPKWSSVGVPYDSNAYGALNVIPWNKMRVLMMSNCSGAAMRTHRHVKAKKRARR